MKIQGMRFLLPMMALALSACSGNGGDGSAGLNDNLDGGTEIGTGIDTGAGGLL